MCRNIRCDDFFVFTGFMGWELRRLSVGHFECLFLFQTQHAEPVPVYIYLLVVRALGVLCKPPIQIPLRRVEARLRLGEATRHQHASPGRGRRRRREGQRLSEGGRRGEGSSEADACGRAAMALLCFLLDLRNIPPPLLHRVKQVPTALPPARFLFLPAHPSVGGEQPQLNPVRRRGSTRLCSACSTSPTSTPPQRHRPNPTPRPPPTPAGSPTAWPSATSTPPPPNHPPPGLRSVIHPPCC